MRPRFAEAESRDCLLGGEFGWGFDNRAEWIAHQAGILTVGVVNAPQLTARFQSRGRAHGGS